ncbi:hypothetical protein LF1_48730 [Rubripirellula obstinata]|uniref:Prophage CP4-57 regulatory protein (AlpA) n=1 Tax=Rubripirellula obstinata TaxID=406547 RepID=A0A5B1CR30_9BACT|nr:helix-turn-helix domain-containing protein [Rubripirellula obstinata]KAA1262309.1 hypothetical protein LF1_48730 [Rubripirellula obstinata]
MSEPLTQSLTRYLTAPQVGLRYSCSSRSVYRLADSGLMPPPIRIGGMVRWSIETLDEWDAAGNPRFRPTPKRTGAVR